MQQLGQAPPTITNEQLMTQHQSALDQVVAAAKEPEFEFERLAQINKARRNWHLVRGNHFLTPGMVATPYGETVDYVPWDGQNALDETGADIRFARPVNVIGGDCYKFVAVMGNSAPRVKAVADDPEDPQSIEDAKNADATLRDLWVKWNADQKQRTLAFHQYTTGPVYLRTIWVRDGKKYGQTVEPRIALGADAEGNPIPQEEGDPQVYENGDVELHVYSVLEVQHPYMSKTAEELPYLKCEVMRSKWDLIAAYPAQLEKYRDQDLPDDNTTTDSTAAAEARESVAAPSGMGRPRKINQWPFREVWVQPFLYEAVAEKDIRDILKQQFANGLYIAKCGSVIVDVDHRKLTDEWAICRVGRGEKIMDDPICADAVPLQQTVNDLFGMALETILRAIAQTIVDSQLIDRESMAKKEALPAEIILTAMPSDGDLTKRVVQIPPARVSDQLVPFLGVVRQYWQDITGIRPELSGGGAPTQTYREAKQRKDQALMQLSPQAQEEQQAWAKAGENGVKMRARYGSGTFKSQRKGAFGTETDVVDMARLSESGWHIEADDNFPMNTSDRFDKIWGLLKEFPPEVQQQLSILDPINLEETLELLQIPGYQSVQEDQKRKTLADISRLMQEQPVDGQPGADGQPGPKQPSQPIDKYDDHAFVADFSRKWMISRTGQGVKNQNPSGFANIEAWQAAHQEAANPPQPPPPPPTKSAFNVAAKAELLPPEVLNEVLQGAGLPPLPPPPPEAAQPPLDPSAPAPIDPPAPESQEMPLPPTGGPEPIPPPQGPEPL